MSMRSTDVPEMAQPGNDDVSSDHGDTSYSLIDRHSIFDGTFRANRNLRIDGEVKGTIECQGTLFVAQGANVSAKVEAESITVAGDLNGDIRCQGRLQIMPSGRVRGKVATVTLVINEGAYYEGQLEMTPPEDRPVTAVPRAINVVTPATAPVPASPGPARTTPSVGQSTETPGPAGSSTFIRRLGGPETPWDTRSEEDDEPAES